MYPLERMESSSRACPLHRCISEGVVQVTRPMRTIGSTVVTFAKHSTRRELVTVSVVCGFRHVEPSNRNELHGVITQLSAHHHPSLHGSMKSGVMALYATLSR